MGRVAVGFVLMWSSGFIGARLSAGTGGTGGTETVLMWRFLVVAVLLVGWSLVRRRPLARSWREFGVQVLIGVLSQAVYLYGVVKAVELGVPSGTSALIAALQPVVAGALVGPVLGERVSARQWLGLGIQCATSAAIFTVLGLASGHAAPGPGAGFWWTVAWFVVLSTIGGYGCYWLTLRRGDVTRVSSLLYLTPPTTMLLAFVLFGWLALLGIGVCVVSVLLVRRPGRPPAEPLPAVGPLSAGVTACRATSAEPSAPACRAAS